MSLRSLPDGMGTFVVPESANMFEQVALAVMVFAGVFGVMALMIGSYRAGVALVILALGSGVWWQIESSVYDSVRAVSIEQSLTEYFGEKPSSELVRGVDAARGENGAVAVEVSEEFADGVLFVTYTKRDERRVMHVKWVEATDDEKSALTAKK